MLEALPRDMRAAVIDRFGDLDTLRVATLPLPPLGRNDVLLRVEAAGVGVWDPFEREGGFAQLMGTTPSFPYVLGSEGAGTIAAVGEAVTRFKPGERAYAVQLATSRGFYAEYAVAPAERVSRVPGRLSTEQAAALAVDGLTALKGLQLLNLRPGETLAIFGAGGGLGHLALQLAKRMGARVLAAASGDDGVALARRLGADQAVDGRREGLARGYDAALLTAGGEAAQRVVDGLRDGGRAAYPHGVEPEPRARAGIQVDAYDGDFDAERMETLNRLVESGPFEVHVAATFPLEQVKEAQRSLDRHYLGKLALRPAA
jgi:NADPH:quinone reductase-like Zn-dependent oxidoreductase